MGFMDRFTGKGRKNSRNIEENQVSDEISENMQSVTDPYKMRKEVKYTLKLNTQAERLTYVKDNCELILESDRQIEEAKVEYQAVTSYLTDMQKIDMIPLEQRSALEDDARKIINLTQERNKLQKRDNSLPDSQYRLFERYELQIPKELPLIRESEEYQAKIQQDMKYLSKERRSLEKEEEDIRNKQVFMKWIAITTSVIVIILFIIFAALSNYSEASFTIPFLLTVLMGMTTTLYIVVEARHNHASSMLLQMKFNRQVMLMNKVKIKSVNNRNYLDYTYSKYMVENYQKMKSAWEEYVRIKDESRRYQTNTELLEFYNNELVDGLKKVGITDSEIWIYQPTAILDNKEMVEVRHRLNVRRQKLRERIETNSTLRAEAVTSIKSTLATFPEGKEELERSIQKYRIDLAK
ncbi:MAG: hypothetical protein WBI07_19445 [Mobilitalea sp.]